jgi:hypothetical protein
MFWGAFNAKWQSPLMKIEGRLNSERYVQILLDSGMIPENDQIWGSGRWWFLQDGASCHKSAHTMNFLRSCSVHLIDHPPRSPDLNPIENIWAIIKDKLSKLKLLSKNEIIENVEKIWEDVSRETRTKLARRMPVRLRKIKRSKGGIPLK